MRLLFASIQCYLAPSDPHFLIASRIESLGNELRADVEPVARIHREHVGGRPAGRSHPDDERSSKREMVSPEVQPRVEQENDATQRRSRIP